jgi:pimeloyl-ACP methyl ester carboxylesterase
MEHINIKTAHFPNIHYRKTGSGPAVVLLHGFPEDGDLWDTVYPALSGQYTVIIPDTPGSGQSTLDEKEPSIESLADCITDILNQENVDEIVLAGHSMGGYISMAFAELRRPWLKGLSMVHSSAAADTVEKKETRRKSIELIRKGGREPFVKGMIPNLFSASYKDQNEDVLDRHFEKGLKLPAESMVAFYNAMINRPDRTSILKELNIPVQWIIGKEDGVIPMNSALQQSKLARVNFVSVYDNCGHMSMVEQPEKLANDLKEFISYCYKH